LEPSLGEATCAEVAGAFLRGDDVALSGGVARAGAGDLLVMVSGSEAAVHRVRPLLEAMASSAPVVGPQPGDGQKGQTRQPAALRRPHRGRGRRARLRRSHAARGRRDLGSAARGGRPRRSCSMTAATVWSTAPTRSRARSRLRQGHGPRARRRPGEQLPRPPRGRRRAALPGRSPRRARTPRRLGRHQCAPW